MTYAQPTKFGGGTISKYIRNWHLSHHALHICYPGALDEFSNRHGRGHFVRTTK